LQCLDQDVGSDDLIGEVKVQVSELCRSGPFWLDIDFKGKRAGQLFLEGRLLEMK